MVEKREELENSTDSSVDEIKYYPDNLMIDEDVLYSSKLNLFLPIYYYITTKRIFSENKLTGKKEEIEYKKIGDLHVEQNFISRYLNKGNILIMHSNYKGDVPIMRRKYFVIKNVKNAQHTFAFLKKEIEKLQKKK